MDQVFASRVPRRVGSACFPEPHALRGSDWGALLIKVRSCSCVPPLPPVCIGPSMARLRARPHAPESDDERWDVEGWQPIPVSSGRFRGSRYRSALRGQRPVRRTPRRSEISLGIAPSRAGARNRAGMSPCRRPPLSRAGWSVPSRPSRALQADRAVVPRGPRGPALRTGTSIGVPFAWQFRRHRNVVEGVTLPRSAIACNWILAFCRS